MVVGILSDTHNDINNIQQALFVFSKHKPELLIFCGDATTVESIEWFCEYQMIYTFGNGDFATGEIGSFLKAYNPSNFAGFSFEGFLENKYIGVTHGHLDEHLNSMQQSGKFDYIFSGHTHIRMDKHIGKTRIINPGSLGGSKKQSRSVALLDLMSDELMFEVID